MRGAHRILIAGVMFSLVLGGCAPVRRLFPNDPPVADAGDDQGGVSVGATVYLRGTGTDADGDDLDFIWYFFLAPPLSDAVLHEWNHATAYFTPDLSGQYVFLLTVYDGLDESIPDKVTITVP